MSLHPHHPSRSSRPRSSSGMSKSSFYDYPFRNIAIECFESSGDISTCTFDEIVGRILRIVYDTIRLCAAIWVFAMSLTVRVWIGSLRLVPFFSGLLIALERKFVFIVRNFLMNRKVCPRLSSFSNIKIQLVTSKTYSHDEFSTSNTPESAISALPSLCLLDLASYFQFSDFVTSVCQLWRSGWILSTVKPGKPRFALFWDLAVDDQPERFLVLFFALLLSFGGACISFMESKGKAYSLPLVVYYPRTRDGWIFRNGVWLRDASGAPGSQLGNTQPAAQISDKSE